MFVVDGEAAMDSRQENVVLAHAPVVGGAAA